MGKKPKKPKNITDGQKSEFWVEHLPYEIDMMRAMHSVAQEGAISRPLHNSHVESFLLHCRNLIEFFKYNPPCDFSPTFFTKPGFKIDRNFLNASLYTKINQQISHLTANRTSVAKDKLGPDDWPSIRNAIEREISRLAAAMTDDYRAKWKYFGPTTIKIGIGTGPSSSFVVISAKMQFPEPKP